ncbi:MAG: hypothetical protein UX89_C0002G0030 [Parcubacteria group bacterium GW2011_GWA2_47_16]|nr:MAG: hypothetical protein UX89_C0002G0030 [Parcubacteria group bacterium GW2011_GWA2_47_16]
MAVRITEIAPKITPRPENVVVAHSSIQNFKWVNEQTLQTGVSSLPVMFDWIVNKKGQAFVKIGNNLPVPVFGTVAPTGQQYLRCLRNSSWSDELLELPLIIS